jgi:hypothetical protein
LPSGPGEGGKASRRIGPTNYNGTDTPTGAGHAGGGAPACLEGRGEKMPKVVLANAFSLSMLPMSSTETILKVKEAGIEEIKELLARGFESAVGHESTAAFLTSKLGIEVKADRRQITIDTNTVLVVFQLMSRLPEGKVLSEQEMSEIKYRFYVVTTIQGESTPPQRG